MLTVYASDCLSRSSSKNLPPNPLAISEMSRIRLDYAFPDQAFYTAENLTDPSTFEAPHAYAVGFTHVIVNGVPVIRDTEFTDARPGRPVKLKDE